MANNINPDWKPISDAEVASRFIQLTSTKNVDEQAIEFLKSFINVFRNCSEEVLNLAEEFVQASALTGSKPDRATLKDLDERNALLFMEKRKEAQTTTKFREDLLKMDLDKNRRLAFVEYALWKFAKDKGDDKINPQFLVNTNVLPGPDDVKYQEAINRQLAVIKQRRDREEKMASLQATYDNAPDSVKGKSAIAQLAQMKSEDQTELNKQEALANAAKRRAEKDKVDPFLEEQKRIEADKKAKEEEEKQKVAASKANLKAKASLWENK